MAARVCLLIACALLVASSLPVVAARKELKLLHVLSVNKFYVPGYNPSSTAFEAPKNLSYRYFLNNAVDIPNSIKMDLFNLGAYLRNMYGGFIGSLYTDEVIRMQTTEFPVSIIAGELINAGLWPPVVPQIWKDDLAWQPIPFDYKSAEEDTVLLGTICPNFEYETINFLKNHYNLTAEQTTILNLIKMEGRISVANPIDVSLLYLALENSKALNQTSPEWLKQLSEESLLGMALSAYDFLSWTTLQRRLNGGPLLKKILRDSRDHMTGVLSVERKINVYSGDERNFAGVLKGLDLPFYELPSAGAAIVFELLAEADKYFVKVNYYTGTSNETLPQKLTGCDIICPFEKFTEIVADVIPENELSLCGSMIANTPNNETGGADASILLSTTHTLLVVASLLLSALAVCT